jgi:hypothetical protein
LARSERPEDRERAARRELVHETELPTVAERRAVEVSIRTLGEPRFKRRYAVDRESSPSMASQVANEPKSRREWQLGGNGIESLVQR